MSKEKTKNNHFSKILPKDYIFKTIVEKFEKSSGSKILAITEAGDLSANILIEENGDTLDDFRSTVIDVSIALARVRAKTDFLYRHVIITGKYKEFHVTGKKIDKYKTGKISDTKFLKSGKFI